MTEVKTAKINFRADDKIGLPDFSSITYGLSISRDVEDVGGEEGMAAIMAETETIVKEVEGFLAKERGIILELIQGSAHQVTKK